MKQFESTPAVSHLPPPKKRYVTPTLQVHRYTVVTGASFPIVTNGLRDRFDLDRQNY